jgi:hypothetical protein
MNYSPKYHILNAKDWYTDRDGSQCRVVLCKIEDHPSTYEYGTFIQVKNEKFHDPMMSGHFFIHLDAATKDFQERPNE